MREAGSPPCGGLWGSPLPRRLPGPDGRNEFTKVTARGSTSGCSPPRLGALGPRPFC
jgi:hypothetical protein